MCMHVCTTFAVNKSDIVAGTPESHALASEHGITASVLHNVLAEKGEVDSDAEDGEEERGGLGSKESGSKVGERKGKDGGEAGEGKAGLKKDGLKGKEGHADAAAARTAGAASTSAQQQEAGYTVFVRGLPLDVTQVQLQAKMEAYGRVKACSGPLFLKMEAWRAYQGVQVCSTLYKRSRRLLMLEYSGSLACKHACPVLCDLSCADMQVPPALACRHAVCFYGRPVRCNAHAL
eukprot:scaffold289857_cov23-Tisochrysis_lutea.AAC.1